MKHVEAIQTGLRCLVSRKNIRIKKKIISLYVFLWKVHCSVDILFSGITGKKLGLSK